MSDTHTTIDGDALDFICWRRYGRQSGAVEAVLDANPHLAERGVHYDAGLVITLPALRLPPRTPLRLWD